MINTLLKAVFLFILSFVFNLNSASAQDSLSISEVQVLYTQVPNNNNSVDSVNRVTYIVTINDTINISKIHFKVGSTEDSEDKFKYVFNTTFSNSLPKNVSINRVGYNVYITIGDFVHSVFFYEIDLEDKKGKIFRGQKGKL